MRILGIHLHNFKGVSDMYFPLTEVDAIILGGKNGYGKTTIFDALELVLTGQIERYSNYEKKLFDHRRSLNDVEMPLVCKVNVPDVSVAVDILYEDTVEHRVTLVRKAKVEDMNNPVDFNVFHQLYISQGEEEPHPITKEERAAIGLDIFATTYGILGYLSQEESTLFVKSSDSERAQTIQYLFNTKRFDERIEKIDKLILKGVKKYAEELKSKQSDVKARIEDLKKYQVNPQEVETEYITIFKEDAQIQWDKVDVRLSNEEYHSLLVEHGVIDGLLYLAENWNEAEKYRKSLLLNEMLEKSPDFALYWQFRGSRTAIKLWKEFETKTVAPFEKLELKEMGQYALIVPNGLEQVISNEVIEVAVEAINRVKAFYRSATIAERAYNEMLDQRNRLQEHLRSHAEQLSQTECPLCGHNYEDVKELLDSLERTSQMQQESTRVFSDQAAREFLKMKEMLEQTVINPAMVWFNEQGINEELVDRYLFLDDKYLEIRLAKLIEKGYIKEEPEGNVQATETVFRKAIEEHREPFNDSLDYQWLTMVYDNYGKLMLNDCRQGDVIKKKRAYLLRMWGMQQSNQMEKLKRELRDLETKTNACAKKDKALKALRTEIERQKNEWLKQVITDVEVLFYIYSGRIMQDNFFGRGLFMKTEPGKYIYFVSDPKSEVDALYKLSSGQLVALMMSLLLSLNKLYATEKFIAIDDPVQTIDDINVWGFVETLRHEFGDYQLLFSTHELSYGSFLRYKLSRMGIRTEYRDMLEERRKQV